MNNMLSNPRNTRLFIANIPKHWTEEDLMKAVIEIGGGVDSVELLKEPNNPGRNRGFAFIDYDNYECAEYSRNNMSNPKFKLDNNTPTVQWAKPKYECPNKKKVIYVRNLPENTEPDRLKQLFLKHGEITKVVIPPATAQNHGYVHFAERTSARKALADTEKYEIDGRILNCSLAKRRRPRAKPRTPVSQYVHPTYPPQPGYGLVGSTLQHFPPPPLPGFQQHLHPMPLPGVQQHSQYVHPTYPPQPGYGLVGSTLQHFPPPPLLGFQQHLHPMPLPGVQQHYPPMPLPGVQQHYRPMPPPQGGSSRVGRRRDNR